jgi:hypothetical protein
MSLDLSSLQGVNPSAVVAFGAVLVWMVLAFFGQPWEHRG